MDTGNQDILHSSTKDQIKHGGEYSDECLALWVWNTKTEARASVRQEKIPGWGFELAASHRYAATTRGFGNVIRWGAELINPAWFGC